VTLKIEIKKDNGIPIYLQIEEQIRLHIHGGTLEPGDPMPTVRELAVQLGINYNTVSRIYRDLQFAGVLVLKRGIGTFVAEKIPQKENMSSQSFKIIEEKARELVLISKRTDLSSVSLSQLIERIWQEEKDEKQQP